MEEKTELELEDSTVRPSIFLGFTEFPHLEQKRIALSLANSQFFITIQ